MHFKSLEDGDEVPVGPTQYLPLHPGLLSLFRFAVFQGNLQAVFRASAEEHDDGPAPDAEELAQPYIAPCDISKWIADVEAENKGENVELGNRPAPVALLVNCVCTIRGYSFLGSGVLGSGGSGIWGSGYCFCCFLAPCVFFFCFLSPFTMQCSVADLT